MTQVLSQKGRLWAAAIVSGPTAGAIVGFGLGVIDLIFVLLSYKAYVTAFPMLWTGMVIVGAIFGLVLGVPVIAILGLPLHSYLLKRGAVSSIDYLLAGALAGIIPAAIAVPIFPRSAGWDSSWFFMILFWMGGPIAAYIAWLIRRPDRDEPPAHLTQPPAA